MKIRLVLPVLIAAVSACGGGGNGAMPTPPPAVFFTNPIVPAAAPDPSVVYHEGFYYYARNIGNARIGVAKVKRLQDIGVAPMVAVFTAPAGQAYSRDFWAPELKYTNGRWYIYFAAVADTNSPHYMFALQSDSQNAQGSYTFKGQVTDAASADRYAFDGTTLQKNDGTLYFIWSGEHTPADPQQCLFIAPMSDPVTISGTRVEISCATYDWEKVVRALNEGPEVIIRNNTINLVYSASASWAYGYKLGLLTNRDGQVLNSASWVKRDTPIFQANPDAQVYGPGHNSFTTSPDGKEDWLVYHAYPDASGGWPNRSTRAQPFSWNADDTPNLGVPVASGVPIAQPSGSPTQPYFKYSLTAPNSGVTLSNTLAPNTAPADLNWQVVPGLSSPNYVSLKATTQAGDYYLRQRSGVAYVEANDGSAQFGSDASWIKLSGLSNPDLVSFQPSAFADTYLIYRDGHFVTGALQSDAEKPNATFVEY
jgi:GH43 family beta-xylosidase